jgi:transcriptional regulator with XRE-family HTH domain
MKLKEVRNKKGMTIAELANASGVSRYMIIMIEKGYKNYKRATIWKLANALGVDAKEIENE